MQQNCPKCGTPMCIRDDGKDFIYSCFRAGCEYQYGVQKTDNVNHPQHYTHGGIETIDYLQAKLPIEEFVGYLKGNILKYMSRANLKNGVEDYKKAQWYLNKLLEVVGDEKK